MSWDVKIAERAVKQLKRIPEKDAQRLSFILQSLSQNPYEGDLEKIKGEENVWRRRIGNYRIIYEVFPGKKFIFIENVKRRTDTTYN